MPVTEDEQGHVDEETSLLPERDGLINGDYGNEDSRATGSGAGTRR